MRTLLVLLTLMSFGFVQAQNLELNQGKDIRQPGKINPALAGIQEDLVRFLSEGQIGRSNQFMLEGRMPLKLGNYMIGYERTFTDDVSNKMFNLTYGRKIKGEKRKLEWRYGGTIQINTKSLLNNGFDSTSGYTFKDLNGEIQSVKNKQDLKSSINYADVVLGTSVNYKNLMAGLSIENFLGSNVSLSEAETRKLPFTANLVLGGFVGVGKNTLFPALVLVANQDDFYTKASLDFSTEKMNFATAYISEPQRTDISGSIAYKGKKSFYGIKYLHPLNDDTGGLVNTVPTFSLFLNSTLFKSRNLFKSDFAKKMKQLY
mgnify:FL=1